MRSRVSVIVDRIQQLPVTLFSPADLARARWVDVARNFCGTVCVPAYDLKPSLVRDEARDRRLGGCQKRHLLGRVIVSGAEESTVYQSGTPAHPIPDPSTSLRVTLEGLLEVTEVLVRHALGHRFTPAFSIRRL